MQIQLIKVYAHAGDEKRGYGQVELYHFDKREKVLNVLKKLFTFWGIGVFCVFIPALHFFLVPLFLGLGVYFAWRAAKVEARVNDGKVECPACGAEVEIEHGLAEWPLTEICQKCVNTLRILPAGDL